MLLLWIASVMWVITVIKERDPLLFKIKANMTHETKVELRNASIYGSPELMPSPHIIVCCMMRLSRRLSSLRSLLSPSSPNNSFLRL